MYNNTIINYETKSASNQAMLKHQRSQSGRNQDLSLSITHTRKAFFSPSGISTPPLFVWMSTGLYHYWLEILSVGNDEDWVRQRCRDLGREWWSREEFHSQYGNRTEVILFANDLVDGLEEVGRKIPNRSFAEKWRIVQEARNSFETIILPILAVAESAFPPVSYQLSSNNLLLLGISWADHVYTEVDAKKAAIALHYKQYRH